MKWKNRGHEYDYMYQEMSEKEVSIYLGQEITGISFCIFLKRRFR